jgi:hypothetical protein
VSAFAETWRSLLVTSVINHGNMKHSSNNIVRVISTFMVRPDIHFMSDICV